LGMTLTQPFGVGGVAAATSAGQVANSLVLIWLDGKHHRLPRVVTVLPAIACHAIAAAGLGAALLVLNRAVPVPLYTSVRSLFQLGVYALVGLAVYAGLLVALRAEEWRELRAVLARRSAR